jgi:hypothetical protein
MMKKNYFTISLALALVFNGCHRQLNAQENEFKGMIGKGDDIP